MKFIRREELPATLRAAYDKAAKGVENDETRTSGENNKALIDSEYEVTIFEKEVSKLKLDKLTKCAIDDKIRSLKAQIECIKAKAESVKQDISHRQQEEKKEDFLIHKARKDFETYKKEHPIKYRVNRALGWLTLSFADTEYQRLKDAAKYYSLKTPPEIIQVPPYGVSNDEYSCANSAEQVEKIKNMQINALW